MFLQRTEKSQRQSARRFGTAAIGLSLVCLSVFSIGTAWARDLTWAQRLEQQGNMYQAALDYSREAGPGNYDITPQDTANAMRNHTSPDEEARKRAIASDPMVNTINQRWAACAAKEISNKLSGVHTPVRMDAANELLLNAYDALKQSDPDDAAWYYLTAVYWCTKSHIQDWNYRTAQRELDKALKCSRISDSVRQKCLALQQHIKPAVKLQVMDRQAAAYGVMGNIVQNTEHPVLIGTHSVPGNIQGTRRWTANVYSNELVDQEAYPDAKRLLADQPRFMKEFNQYIDYLHSLPNQGDPVPAGPPTDAPALFCPPQWEQLAFGPLDFGINKRPVQ